jgi:hypothetical protein
MCRRRRESKLEPMISTASFSFSPPHAATATGRRELRMRAESRRERAAIRRAGERAPHARPRLRMRMRTTA